MRKFLVAVVSAVVLLHATTAHGQRIRGHALEDETREPVAGAVVELRGPDGARLATATTDSTGSFLLEPRRAGSFFIRVTHLAYLPVDSAALTVSAGETLQIELRLATRVIPLEPLVVTSRGDRRIREFYERMDRGGFGRFLSREDIERRPGVRPTELLRGVAGIQLVPVTPAGSGYLITMRGGGASGRCLPTIYIDGMLTHQHSGAPIDAYLHSEFLEGVEVYSGMTAPAPLLPRSGCGVVAFWTRRDGGRPFSWRRAFTAAGIIGALFGLTTLLTR
jgi:hypothetical protein